MALTAAQQQDLLRVELGLDAYSDIRAQINTVWGLYADRGAISPRAQYLYTARHLLRVVLGKVAGKVDWKEADVSQSDSQLYKNYSGMLEDVNAEIKAMELSAAGNRAPVAGQLVTVVPEPQPTTSSADAADPAYRGSPYRGSGWWH